MIARHAAPPTESAAKRLRKIVDSGTFMWAQDGQTLMDAVLELEHLELCRFIHKENTKRLDNLLEGKPA